MGNLLKSVKEFKLICLLLLVMVITGCSIGTPDISGTYVDSDTGCKMIISGKTASLKCDVVGRDDSYSSYTMTKGEEPWIDYDVIFHSDSGDLSCYIGEEKTNKSISCKFAGGYVNFYK